MVCDGIDTCRKDEIETFECPKQSLRVDFHTHSSDDPIEALSYSSEMLIDEAAQKGIDVLCIVGHNEVIYTSHLSRYAAKRGILLIPGVELDIENKHVLVINPHEEHIDARTFSALRTLKGRGELIIAPHPFYPSSHSLGKKLLKHIDIFDAIELCAFHIPFLGCNNRAKKVAMRYSLPMVATTDTHELPYDARAYTLVNAPMERSAILEAVRQHRCTPIIEKTSIWAAYSALGRTLRSHLHVWVEEGLKKI